MMSINIYYKSEKQAYAKYLIERFGSVVKAAAVIDEMLKVCSDGSDRSDLKDTRKIIFEISQSNN